jgi:hypothetical protein
MKAQCMKWKKKKQLIYHSPLERDTATLVAMYILIITEEY